MLRNFRHPQVCGLSLRKIVKETLLLVSLLFFSNMTYAGIVVNQEKSVMAASDKASVVITVVDSQSGDPIPGAVIRSSDLDNPCVTDQAGRSTLVFKQSTGKSKVTVSYIGYKNSVIFVNMQDGAKVTVRLKEDAQTLKGVTVTTQRRHTNTLQQAAAIDQSVLEKGGATSLAKMLETIPGVSSISAGSTVAKPVIQGMHSSRILLMNNGVKLESQSWGNDHAPEIDYTGASMVEVVKGAECIRYGFGAMGGVVLLNDAPLPYGHKKPIVKGVANIGYDTNARGVSGSGSIEAGWKNFGVRFHGNYTKGGDYHTPEYIMNNTGYNNISMSTLGGFENKHITATVLASLFYQREGIYFGSQISDLTQLQERFRIGRPLESSLQPFSYHIGYTFPAVATLYVKR